MKDIDIKNKEKLELGLIRRSLGNVNCMCPFCHNNTLKLCDAGRTFYCNNCKNGFNAWLYLESGKIIHGFPVFKIIKTVLKILFKNQLLPIISFSV